MKELTEEIDWAEDKFSDGEIYITSCPRCRRKFTGHKHRKFCKQCVKEAKPNGQ